MTCSDPPFPFRSISHSEKKRERATTLFNQCCPTIYGMITHVITAVTKSSMKPQSGTTTNRHLRDRYLRGSGKRNGD